MPDPIEYARARQVTAHPSKYVHHVDCITLNENEFVVHCATSYAMFEAQLDENGDPVIRLVTEPLSAYKMFAHDIITQTQHDEYIAKCAERDSEKLEQIEFAEYLRLSKKYGEVNLDEAIKACELIRDSLHSLRTGTPKSSSL